MKSVESPKVVQKRTAQALDLKPEEKLLVVEGLLKRLDEPDRKLYKIWADEAERRLKAYREGRLDGIPMEKIFKK